MTRDRREHKKLTRDAVKEILNQKQLSTLIECQYLGWKLKFIRRPLFLEPIPVIYNARFDQIGIMDPDGHINIDVEFEIRSSGTDKTGQPPQAHKAPETESWKEKRKHTTAATENPDELLNQNERRALRQIETFGWRLHFLRKSSSRYPEPVILSPRGDKFAILERDGRINMTPDLTVRHETPIVQTETTAPIPAQEIKLAE
jgi:hypothetical protein